jgi:redox-sensitive bicupin YhaK (pirin superfamily)
VLFAILREDWRGPGSVQWMTAGRGIVHSEMPLQENGLMRGFQLWVNLPARDKMTAPRYQDIPSEAIATVSREGAVLRVIAGVTHEGVRGPVGGVATDPLYLDVALAPGARFGESVPAGHNAFCYVYEGEVEIADTAVGQGHLAVLGDGDAIALRRPAIVARGSSWWRAESSTSRSRAMARSS